MRGPQVVFPWKHVAALALVTCAMPVPAQAQLDPLIALKRVPPNVVVVIDTSFRMLDDGTGTLVQARKRAVGDDPPQAVQILCLCRCLQFFSAPLLPVHSS